MSSTLHITNGDCAANLLKASEVIRGDILPWRDPMHHGPFPPDLSLDKLSITRAEYLSGPGLSEEDTRRGFQLRDNHLIGSDKYDKIMLWFEHDLLDQLQILQILDWFSLNRRLSEKLYIICIDKFPGFDGFRGLGQLKVSQLETLIGQEDKVSEFQIELASKAWKTFRSDDPNNIVEFLRGDCRPLEFLEPCLRRFLEEYPWLQDGLSRSERQILQIIEKEITLPGRIFHETMQMENHLFAGDWRIFSHINDLCQWGLLECKSGKSFQYPPHFLIPQEEFKKQEVVLTDTGYEVLVQKQSGFDNIIRDEWLGGVHLKTGVPFWIWDNNNQSFTRDIHNVEK